MLLLFLISFFLGRSPPRGEAPRPDLVMSVWMSECIHLFVAGWSEWPFIIIIIYSPFHPKPKVSGYSLDRLFPRHQPRLNLFWSGIWAQVPNPIGFRQACLNPGLNQNPMITSETATTSSLLVVFLFLSAVSSAVVTLCTRSVLLAVLWILMHSMYA